MRRAFLAHVTLLWAVSSVQAFFAWYPPYLCTEDHICVDETGSSSVKGRAPHTEPTERQAEGVTFQLFQRKPENHEDTAGKAARNAARLMRKHAFKATRTSETEHELDRRGTNTYSIITAATPTATNSDGIDQDGSDFSYFIEVGIGSGPTPMYMLLDSGAGTTWVMGATCESTACLSHNSFTPSDSDTYVASSKTFDIDYGSGSVSGELAKDTLAVADMKTSMTFGIANITSDDFTHFPFDGILGLSMSTGATDNFLSVMKDDKLLSSNIFGIEIGRASDGTNTGQITFGATDSSKYTGSISYSSVDSSAGGDWAIALGDIGYNGNAAGISDRLAYIDTGTSYVFGPQSDVEALHALIPGANSTDGGTTYSVPCNSNEALTITFSGVTYSISSKDWLSGSGDTCTSNIYGHEVVSGAWLLGDVFLKNVYSVFDWDESRIGFASKAGTSSTSTSTSSFSTVTTGASTVTGAPVSTASGSTQAGLSGHETAATAAGTAVAETSGTGAAKTAVPTVTQVSPGEYLENNKYVSILCVVAIIAMVT